MLNKKHRATFLSPCLKKKKPKEREFDVDSGASMHMMSIKDLNSAELETVRLSRNPTTVVTTKGELQTNEEATVHVKDTVFISEGTST